MPRTLVGFVLATSLWHQLALIALSIVVFLLGTAPLELQRRIVNDAVKNGAIDAILPLALAYAGLALLEGVIKLGLNIYRSWVGECAVRTLRQSVLALHAGEPAMPEADGVEISMVLSEAEPIGSFIGISASEPVLQGGLLLSVFGYMVFLQPMMAMFAFVIFAPQFVFVPLMQRAINRRVRSRITSLRAVSVGMIGGSHDSSGEAAQAGRIEEVFTLNMRIFQIKFTMNFLMNITHHFGTATALAVGGWLAIGGHLEVGTVVAFVSGLAKLNDPWGDLVNWFREMTVIAVKYRLIADTMDVIITPGAVMDP